MIRFALAFIALPTLVQANVLICEFTPQTCATTSCDPFTITINTHHGADTPQFEYDGTTASIVQIPDGAAQAQSFVTLGHADREVITLFNGFDAIHTRHFTLDDIPTAQTSTGRCTSFY